MYKPLLLISLIFLQINVVHSEIYKWIDENGKTVYGDKPVSDDAKQIIIKKVPERDKLYEERINKQNKLLDVMKEERDENIAIKNKEKEDNEKKEKECSKLIKELQEIESSNVLYETTDDPNNPRIYSDEERKAEEDKLKKLIKENCQ